MSASVKVFGPKSPHLVCQLAALRRTSLLRASRSARVPRKCGRGLQYLRLEWTRGWDVPQGVCGVNRIRVLDGLKCRCASAVP